MPQSSLGRSPASTKTKFTAWSPKWILGGTGNPKPVFSVPVVITAPVASSTSLSVAANGVASCTNGNWYYSPTSYAYQWLRDGANISGATNQLYTLVSADATHSISCKITPSNSKGAGTASTSNALAIVA